MVKMLGTEAEILNFAYWASSCVKTIIHCLQRQKMLSNYWAF